MSDSQIVESDLIKLQSMTGPENYHEVVHRIFDKKLRSFLSLPSKEEVLQNCQQLLITKTIDYMNCINQMEKKQLTALNSLNTLLIDKDVLINDLKLQIRKFQIETKDQQLMINSLSKELETNKKALVKEQLKLQQEISRYNVLLQEQQRAVSILKSEHSAYRSTLEAANKELSYELALKTTELKNALSLHKQQSTALKSQKQRDTMQFNRKLKQKSSDFQNIRQQLNKQKKYLQDVIQIKQDQIKQAKKPKIRRLIEQSQFSFQIKGQKQKTPKQSIPRRPRSKTRSKQMLKDSIQDIKDIPQTLTQSADNEPIILAPILKDVAVQHDEIRNYESPKTQIKKQKILLDVEIQTQIQDPMEEMEMNEQQIKLRDFMEQKYKILYDQKAKNLSIKMKQEYLSSLKDAQVLMNHLKQYTNQRVQLSILKITEVQQVYLDRPSREEDSEFIKKLIKENQALADLCYEANRKTDSAYLALQQYHNRLQNYKKSVPVNIQGNLPPKVNSQKIIRENFSTRNGRMHTSPGKIQRNLQRTLFFNSNFKQKKEKMDDLDSLTKQILQSEYDTQSVLSPIRKPRMSRPQTGGGIGFRRKSFL